MKNDELLFDLHFFVEGEYKNRFLRQAGIKYEKVTTLRVSWPRSHFSCLIGRKGLNSFELLLFILEKVPEKCFCLALFWHGRGKYETMQHNNVYKKCSETMKLHVNMTYDLQIIFGIIFRGPVSLWFPFLLLSYNQLAISGHLAANTGFLVKELS